MRPLRAHHQTHYGRGALEHGPLPDLPPGRTKVEHFPAESPARTGLDTGSAAPHTGPGGNRFNLIGMHSRTFVRPIASREFRERRTLVAPARDANGTRVRPAD